MRDIQYKSEQNWLHWQLNLHKCSQAFQELQQARTELEQLRQLAAEHGQLMEELAAARAQVRELEKQRSQYDSMASRAVTAIESRMASIAKERDMLQEQARHPRAAPLSDRVACLVRARPWPNLLYLRSRLSSMDRMVLLV